MSHDSRSLRTNLGQTQGAQLRYTSFQDPATSERTRVLNAGGRVTRSAANHGPAPQMQRQAQSQLPLHSHGFHNDVGMYHNTMGMDAMPGWYTYQQFAGNMPANTEQMPPRALPENEYGSESGQMPFQYFPYTDNRLTYPDSHDALPGLALRPGNPNLSFASSNPSIKRSPTFSHFGGKENGSLGLKQAVHGSNPYLQTNTSSGENYNPLCVQPRDGLGFNMYSSYDEGAKPAMAPSFQAINNQGGFGSMQMTSQQNAAYSSNQGGNDFDL